MVSLCTGLEIAPGGGRSGKNNLLDMYFFFFCLKETRRRYKKMSKSVLWWVETGRWRWVGVKNLHWLNKPFFSFIFLKCVRVLVNEKCEKKRTVMFS